MPSPWVRRPVPPRCRPGAVYPCRGQAFLAAPFFFVPRCRPGACPFSQPFSSNSRRERLQREVPFKGDFSGAVPLEKPPPKWRLHSLGAVSLVYALCCHFAAAVRWLVLASSVSFTSAGAAKAHSLRCSSSSIPTRFAGLVIEVRETESGSFANSVPPFSRPAPGDPRGPAGSLGRAKGILKGKPLRNGFPLSAPLPTFPARGK